jgi:hypothetical protein
MAHLVDQLDDDLVFLDAARSRTEAVLTLADRWSRSVVPAAAAPPGRDIQLTPDERADLCTELAAAFGSGTRASHLLEEIGLPRERQIGPVGATALEWWNEILRELANGAVERPYRRVLAAALRWYAYNDVFVRLARRHGLR